MPLKESTWTFLFGLKLKTGVGDASDGDEDAPGLRGFSVLRDI